MIIIKTSDSGEVGRFIAGRLDGPESMLIHVAREPVVSTGQLNTLDLVECERRGLYVGKWEYLGGTIVVMPGDLSMCIVTWGESDLAQQIVDTVAEWLAGRGIEVTRDGNDVMAYGKKVVSWARATNRNGWCQSVVHFSVGPMDLDLVRAICTKPMVKVPGSLGKYGISANDILAELAACGLLKGDL